MSDNNRKRRKTKIGGAFSYHLIEMISSPAFCVLSLSARRVLDRLEIELASHGGTSNGKLPVTFADFHRYGIDYNAIAPAIREVVALGFVEITKKGRAGNEEISVSEYFPADVPTHRLRRFHRGMAVHYQQRRSKIDCNRSPQAHQQKLQFHRGKPGLSVGGIQQVSVGEVPTTVSPGKPRLLTISPSDTVRGDGHAA